MSNVIIVTGGAGFLGSAIIWHLLYGTKHPVANVDKLTYAANLELLEETLPSSLSHFEPVNICSAAEGARV